MYVLLLIYFINISYSAFIFLVNIGFFFLYSSVTTKITLWGDLGEMFDCELYKKNDKPTIVILTSTTIKRFQSDNFFDISPIILFFFKKNKSMCTPHYYSQVIFFNYYYWNLYSWLCVSYFILKFCISYYYIVSMICQK